MFILGSVGALDIAKRRVVLDNSGRNQVVQLHKLISIDTLRRRGSTHPKEVLVLAQPVEVTATEGKSTEVLVDDVQQVLRRRETQGDLAVIRDQSVVRGFHLHITISKLNILANRCQQLTSSLT